MGFNQVLSLQARVDLGGMVMNRYLHISDSSITAASSSLSYSGHLFSEQSYLSAWYTALKVYLRKHSVECDIDSNY